MKPGIDPREIFIKGTHVVLKVLTRDDVINSNWYGWFNDEELCATLQKHYFPNTVDSQLEYWETHVRHATDRIQLGICKADGNAIIGIISLSHVDLINRKAELSLVIGEKESHNVTIFNESCRLLLNHAFNSLNLNRVYGGSISRELVVLMCRMLGCKEEGVARQDIFKNGTYHDAYRYSVLRDEFRA